MWNLEELYKFCNNGTHICINDKWVPCRSINYKHRNLSEKIKEAYMVFSGKADCFIWPEGQ